MIERKKLALIFRAAHLIQHTFPSGKEKEMLIFFGGEDFNFLCDG